MFVFLVIFCFSILLMYAAIHPEGLVIYRQANLLNTRISTNATTVAGNDSHRSHRGPPGVTVVPVDPWWIRLVETESPSTRDIPDGKIIFDWGKSVRVKVTNKTTEAFHKKAITYESFTSSPPKPKFTTTNSTPPKSHDILQYEKNDENTIMYNYKSHMTSIRKN